MRTFSKIKKYSKPSLELDEKIESLDKELKKTLGEAIANSTSGVYTVTGFEPGDPAIPPIPAVPPTYDTVDPGSISDPNTFVWPEDQGDGSNPNTPPNIPSSLYSTYNGEQVPALRQVDVNYGEGVTPLAFVGHTRALSSTVIGYLTQGGFTVVVQSGVYTTPGPYTEIQQKYLETWDNLGKGGLLQYYTMKEIYLWGPLDCLGGGCWGGIQYSPANLSNTTEPKATYALYPYTMYIPTNSSGNALPNQIMTDPGSPEIPGVPAGPLKPVVISRNSLGDPNYYPGPAQPQGDVAQLGPLEVEAMLDIIRGTPGTPDAQRARETLDRWAKPGSKNRDILIKMGVFEGASLPSINNQKVAQYDPYTGYGETPAQEKSLNQYLLRQFEKGEFGDPSSPQNQKQIQNLRNSLKSA